MNTRRLLIGATGLCIVGVATRTIAEKVMRQRRLKRLFDQRDDLLRQRAKTVTSPRCTLLRAVQLGTIFAPAVALSPLLPLVPSLWWKSFRWSLETAGPVWVKFAQWLSTRPDLASRDVRDHLSGLRSNCRAHSYQDTLRAVEKSLPGGLSDFEYIEEDPVASGAVAQVHRGVLRGRATSGMVAVKVLHPWALTDVTADLHLMKAVTRSMVAVAPWLKWPSLNEAMDDFTNRMSQHLDLRLEACNLHIFRENFGIGSNRHNSKQTYQRDKSGLLQRLWKLWSRPQPVTFPEPMKGLVSQSVLVESFEPGTQLDPMTAPPEVATTLFKAFMKMVVQDNFTHMDLHPGNILLSHTGSLVFLDAGLAAPLPYPLHDNMISLCSAVMDGNSDLAADIMMTKGPMTNDPPRSSAQRRLFKLKMADLFDRVATQPLSKVRSVDVLKDMCDVAHKTKVKLEGRFASLAVAATVLEGVGRQIDPQINLMDVAAPFLLNHSSTSQLYVDLRSDN